LGVRRTAVIATAFLLLGALWATARAQPSRAVLPVGTPVVFVVDGTLSEGAREGTVVPIHLRDALVLDGTVVAASGAHAELLLAAAGSLDGRLPRVIAVRGFTTAAGLMPVRPDHPIVSPVATGTLIEATIRAQVVRIGTRLSILTPFPFPLSNEAPATSYTPTPARTAPPHALVPPRRRGPSPAPSATGSASPAPESSAASPEPTPYPTPLGGGTIPPR
jgi:hypothetical protein